MHSSELLMFLAFNITYNMENEEIWELQRHFLNPKPPWRQSFSSCFAIRLEMTPSIDFSFSPCISPVICCRPISWSLFLFDTDKWRSKREVSFKDESSKGYESFAWHHTGWPHASQSNMDHHYSLKWSQQTELNFICSQDIYFESTWKFDSVNAK